MARRGQIAHRDQVYPGQHPAIIEQMLWDAVQMKLAENRQGYRCLAFLFQLVLHRKQERKTAEISAQRMLFCLLQQMNTLMLVQKDFFSPHMDDPGRFRSIPAVHEFDINKNVFDFSTFGFMLETNESRMIMYDLYLAQESYIEALRALNERSRFHWEEVQPRLASSGVEKWRYCHSWGYQASSWAISLPNNYRQYRSTNRSADKRIWQVC